MLVIISGHVSKPDSLAGTGSTRKIGIFSLMENSAHRIIKNLEVLPELGRQRCFELGNPFYYQDAADAAEPGMRFEKDKLMEYVSNDLTFVQKFAEQAYKLDSTRARIFN